MNKKFIITLGLLSVFAAASYAETTIYTDGIGRMHFLGKDPASNINAKNYSNPQQQDITRRLYENQTGEMNNVDYKFKDYDNTFGIGKMDTQTIWKNKFTNNVDDAMVETSTALKTTMTTKKGAADASRVSAYGATNLDTLDYAENEVNVIKDKSSKKKWWRKKK